MEVFLHTKTKTLRKQLPKVAPVETSCPFCGASTDLPHESQEACIAALQREIAKTREIVERVKPHWEHADSGNAPTHEPGSDRRR